MIMVDKEDLRLSLSLTCSKPQINHRHTSNSLSPNLNSLPPANLPFAFVAPQRTPWIDYSFASSAADLTIAGEPRSFPNGIDVNAAIAEDEEAGVSSPNSTISSASGKRSEREAIDDQEDEDGDTSRKKLRLSKDQSAVLEESFKENHTLNPKQKLTLSKRLGLRPRQVEVWFQNRRARTKLKQTEFDCEFMRKCCEQLTEENRRLQKEVQELRSLKLSPQFYMQMSPPTTLTMCPSCERVAAPPSSGHPQRRLPVNPWGVQTIGQV